ncbi:hypothetical protein AB0D32_29635 [Micromonospora sp. NPDC048170]|uniref:hypothetical protein n=1 Tax=Micromonospora sp. NPDC048170 TaxID=3154819 RepID=UPI0033C4E64D
MSRDRTENAKSSDPSLTAAASDLLSSHLSSTRDRILTEVERARITDGLEGSVRAEDVSAAILRIAAADARIHYLGKLRVTRRHLPSLPVLAIGFLFAAIGAGIFNAVTNRNPDLFLPAALIIGAVSLAVGMLSPAIESHLRSRQARRANKSQLFLQLISKVESKARNYVAREIGLSYAEGPLGIVLAVMREKKVWSDEEINDFRILMRIRNSLVHENLKTISDDHLWIALSQLQRLSDRIPGPRIPWPTRGREATGS